MFKIIDADAAAAAMYSKLLTERDAWLKRSNRRVEASTVFNTKSSNVKMKYGNVVVVRKEV